MLRVARFSLPAALVLLAACPNPLTDAALREMLDKTAPVVTISSPTDGSDYTQTITVQGSATDPGGEVRTLSYQVNGTLGLLTSGELAGSQLGAGGVFSFQFSTIDFNGPIVVTVKVEDRNDNSSQTAITLQYPGSSISSFVAVPGSKHIDLSWEAVAGATGYTIYYTDNGTLPSETYGTQINTTGTSYPLAGLRNGALHTLLLRARMPGGTDYWSGYLKIIPLSELTLAPLVRGGYREIDVEWAAIDATAEFLVLRATSAAGPYENYSGVIRGNSFTDTGVAEGIWYYYKVKPSLAGSLVSTYNAAQTFQVPTSADRITSLTLPAAAKRVRLSGDYAFVAAGASGLLVVDVSNPSSPVLKATLGTTNAKDLVVAGSTLYIADGIGRHPGRRHHHPDFPCAAQHLYRGPQPHDRGCGRRGRGFLEEPPVRHRRRRQHQPAHRERRQPGQLGLGRRLSKMVSG